MLESCRQVTIVEANELVRLPCVVMQSTTIVLVPIDRLGRSEAVQAFCFTHLF